MTTRLEPVWRYPVLTARGEAIERMARAMRNGKAWPAVFSPKAAEQLAEDALSALEAAAPAPEGMLREAIAKLEWRRNARELGAKREALDMAVEGRREAYASSVLESATCEVDYTALATVLALLAARGGSR